MNASPQQLRLALWQYLATQDGCQLIEAAAKIDQHDVAGLTKLRKTWSLEQISAAMKLLDARARATSKFEDPQRLIADIEGVEQASGTAIARHKAARFTDLGQVADLCCGIGGDAIELARVTKVTGFDIDPTRVWMTEHNAHCPARELDITDSSAQASIKQSDAWHIDPSRRLHGKRLWNYADLIPGDETIRGLTQLLPQAAIKLGPGVDFEQIPLSKTDEVEVIGDGRRLYETTWWRGTLAHHPGHYTATNVSAGISLSGIPQRPRFRAQPGIDGLLFEADPALERAGLLGCLPERECLFEAAPGLGLLTSDTPVRSPWLRTYEVVHLMPWRTRNVRLWLNKNEYKVSTVRTRGKAVDPDAVSATLPMSGKDGLVLFVLRLEKKMVAVLTKPGTSL
ncbi:MAG: hypothetical protein P8J86_12610 [Phycisphaerales bacterium]|nr:hypothetical protein [Phycisphaerales bacterium]